MPSHHDAGLVAGKSQSENRLCERTFAFALRVFGPFGRPMEKPGVSRILAPQLLWAGNSVGANYEESQAAQSRPDFISKVNIALKEARETHYWLRLVGESDLVSSGQIADLIDESRQITLVLGSIVSRSRKNNAQS